MRVLLIDNHPLFSAGMGAALARLAPDIELQTADTLDAGL